METTKIYEYGMKELQNFKRRANEGGLVYKTEYSVITYQVNKIYYRLCWIFISVPILAVR